MQNNEINYNLNFVNLYIETEYTMLGSCVKLDELVDFAKENNITSLAITDLNNMHGVIKFYQKCINKGIKPIIGLHLTLNSSIQDNNIKDNSLLLYAKNNNGYENLIKICTLRNLNKILYLDDIIDFLKDIVVILPNRENELVEAYFIGDRTLFSSLYNKYRFIKDLYLGIDIQIDKSKYNINEMVDFFLAYQIKSVAINKTNYLHEDDFDVYKILKCVKLNIKKYDETESERKLFFIKPQKAFDNFRKYPELIKETQKISELCNVKIDFGKYKMPMYDKYDTRLYNNSVEYLKDLSIKGLKKRLQSNNISIDKYQKYLDRLMYELEIIEKMGFCDYFLIVYDFIKYAKKSNILVGPGRGSGPSSIVAYSLGITELDPLEYNLLFERFLNPERISMPDIDTDFPDNMRSDVINYMGTRYSKMRVAHICTFGTYGPRSAIRDIARVMSLNEWYLDEILRYIGDANSIIDVLKTSETFLRMYNEDDQTRFITNLVKKMENLPRNTSIHAAGIIMADRDLNCYTPLEEGIDGLYSTQYEASDLEQLGLVKIDFLGLKNLTIINKTINSIHDKDFNIYKLPLDDKETYKMIASGNTFGVFQLESTGMRNTLKELKCSSFDDIVNALALYRPGPMEMIPSFVNRKFGKEKIDYLHPDLIDILKPTYGIIVYQEQILLIASKFAGYSLGEADVLRRAVSKKKFEMLEKERDKFIKGSIKKGYTRELANTIFDYILKFANYGFNKSHSVAYALVSYQMAYLKRHYFKEFMASLMSDKIGNTELIRNYIFECNKGKIEVKLPSINISGLDFVTYDGCIYYSLLGINGLGEVVCKNIIKDRNENGLYKSFDEFIGRTKTFLSKKHIESLIYSGALDDFKITRKSMIEEYVQSLELANYGDMFKDNLSTHIFGEDEFSFSEISRYEAFALGFNLKFDIFKQYGHLKSKYRTKEINKLVKKTTSIVIFAIKSIKEITTKKGDKMALLTVFDETGDLDVVVFPQTYNLCKGVITKDFVYFGQLKIDIRNEALQGELIKIKKIED